MATRYVTLKDSNGDTIYPQISTDSIASNSITGTKLDWSTMAKNSYSAGNRFTSVQSGQSINLLSTSYTSKTGRVAIVATGPIYTSRYTSFLQINVDGTAKSSSVTNRTSYAGPTVAMWTGDIGTSAVTVATKVVSQDSGTTAYVEQYISYTLLIMDI